MSAPTPLQLRALAEQLNSAELLDTVDDVFKDEHYVTDRALVRMAGDVLEAAANFLEKRGSKP